MLTNQTRKASLAVDAEPYVGLAANQTAMPKLSAPTAATQGTALSAAGSFSGRTAGVIIDLPGSHPP